MFLVLKTAHYHEDREEVHFGEIHVFAGPGYVITVRHGPGSELHTARERLEHRPDLLRLGAASAVWAILDKVVDDYIPVADAIEDDVEEVEKDVFDDDIPAPTARIYNLKREVIEFHRAVWPLLNPLETLEQGGFERVPEELRSLLPRRRRSREARRRSGELAARAAHQRACRRTCRWSASTRTRPSRRSRRSSASSPCRRSSPRVYGMNFDNMPELHWHYGYAYALALMAICVVVLATLLQTHRLDLERAYDGGVFPIAHVGGPVFEPLQVFGLTFVATAYAFRAMTLAREGGRCPTWRTLCFAGGLLLIAVAFLSPLAHLDSELVLAHMSQHLLMGDIGALLIVLGLTGPLLQPLLHNRWLGWIRAPGEPAGGAAALGSGPLRLACPRPLPSGDRAQRDPRAPAQPASSASG